MNDLSSMVAEALHKQAPEMCFDAYLDVLAEAFDTDPPPYGAEEYGDIYRAAAVDGQWMAMSLITNAEREGDGATRLWSLAACTGIPEVAMQLKQHAVDEARHSRAYLTILDLSFPGSTNAEFRRALNDLSPGYTMAMEPLALLGSAYSHALTLDDLVQMNIAEIRTTIHHMLQRPMLELHCDRKSWPHLQRILDSLLHDETAHVRYTAALIEGHFRTLPRDEIAALMQARVGDFNAITRQELQNVEFA